MTDFDKAIDLKPDYAMAYNDRGTLKIKMKEYTSAKTDFTKAVTFDPSFAMAYNNLGELAALAGDTRIRPRKFYGRIKDSNLNILAYQ